MKAHDLAHLMMRRDAGEEEEPLNFNAGGWVAGSVDCPLTSISMAWYVHTHTVAHTTYT